MCSRRTRDCRKSDQSNHFDWSTFFLNASKDLYYSSNIGISNTGTTSVSSAAITTTTASNAKPWTRLISSLARMVLVQIWMTHRKIRVSQSMPLTGWATSRTRDAPMSPAPTYPSSAWRVQVRQSTVGGTPRTRWSTSGRRDFPMKAAAKKCCLEWMGGERWGTVYNTPRTRRSASPARGAEQKDAESNRRLE